MWSRRHFLHRTAGAGAALMLPGWINATGLSQEEITQLVILHTNDVHSRI